MQGLYENGEGTDVKAVRTSPHMSKACGSMYRARRKELPGAWLCGNGRVSSVNSSCCFPFAHQKKMLRHTLVFRIQYLC